MATDPFVVELLHLPHWTEYASMAIFVAFVCGFSKWILSRRKVKCAPEAARGDNVAVAAEPSETDGGK
jgi:hypothetical protein